MLLVASETGHVYTFATRKLQPMITSENGKALIQTCLNSPEQLNASSSGSSIILSNAVSVAVPIAPSTTSTADIDIPANENKMPFPADTTSVFSHELSGTILQPQVGFVLFTNFLVCLKCGFVSMYLVCSVLKCSLYFYFSRLTVYRMLFQMTINVVM